MSKPGSTGCRAATVAVSLVTFASCGASREPLITHFNADFGLTVAYPASWKADEIPRDGISYRQFLAPASGPERQPLVSATLLAGPLPGTLEAFADTMTRDHRLLSSREEKRDGVAGKAYEFTSADGAQRHWLVLLQEENRVYGLHTQAPVAELSRHSATLQEMSRSLRLERVASYPEVRNEKHRFSLRVPVSWRATRTFTGGGTYMTQLASPPLAADSNRQTVHASLTLTVEPFSGDLAAYYKSTRDKLGDSVQVLGHAPWKDGYVDVMRSETQVATSRVKRFYRVNDGRGYSLSFEARDDVHFRVHRWYDLIASTFKCGSEVTSP